MDRVRIEELQIDEYNEAEMAHHNVGRDEIDEVLNGDYRLLRNSGKYPNQPYLMVGRTAAGRWLTIPIGPTEMPGVWRPGTAFGSKRQEIMRALRARAATKDDEE